MMAGSRIWTTIRLQSTLIPGATFFSRRPLHFSTGVHTSLEFDRFARFAMTPLLKLKISSHLRIQRLRSTLPKHPEFAVSGCICYGYETPESPLYLAFQFHYLTSAFPNHSYDESRLYRTDAERQMRPSDWRSSLKIGDGLCRKLIGKGQLWARLSVAKTRANGVAVTCW
jgi:hypothetical protein